MPVSVNDHLSSGGVSPLEDGILEQNKLDKTPSSLKWEHETLAKVRIKVLRGHGGPVNTCQYVNNENNMLSASNDGTARLWQTEDGEVVHVYEGHEARVVCARSDASSSKIVTGSWDKTIKVWDIETAAQLWTGEHRGMVTSCNFSTDGQLCISSSDYDHVVRIWDTRTGHTVRDIKDLHKSTITKCMFTPSGDRVITTSMDKTTKFFDLKSNINTITLGGHINVISNCCMTKDGKNFATCSWDKTIQIWDIAVGTYRNRGATTLAKGHEGSISSIAFSADNSMLVSAGYDTSIILWDLDTNTQKIRLMGHGDWIEDICMSGDGMWIMSCSKDTTIRLWNIAESDEIPSAVDDKKTIGLKVVKCSDCGKPFSMAQMTDAGTICVFCRLQKRTSPTLDIDFTVDPE